MKIFYLLALFLSAASAQAFEVNSCTVDSTLILLYATPNTVLVVNGSGDVISSPVTTTELGYIQNVTSDVQTQLNGKQSTLTFIDSLVNSANSVSLVGDSAAPGNSLYYGTNGGGTKGFFSLPASGVSSVTASSPLFSSGGSTPDISCQTASGSLSGCLSSVDWSTFNGKQSALTFGSVSSSTTGVTVGNGSNSTVGPNVTVNVQTASTTQPGLLSSSDWNTFNGKQSALTFGNLTDVGTDGITVTGGTGAVIGSGTSVSQHVSDTTHSGYLSSTDWNTFNGKQAAGSYITALTGDGTASGPGSAALTLATVNSNVGSFTNSSITVNAKGLVTAASSGTTGNLTDAGTDGITVTGGTGAVLGSGTSLSQHASDTTHSGYLNSTDWNTFNGKVSSVTASSPVFSSGGTTPNITVQDASGSQSGVVNTTTQAFAGAKSITGSLTLTGDAAGTTPFTVNAHPSTQSVNILNVVDQNLASRFSIDSGGNSHFVGNTILSGMRVAGNNATDTIFNSGSAIGITATAGAGILIDSSDRVGIAATSGTTLAAQFTIIDQTSVSRVPFAVQEIASQTADATDWFASDGTTKLAKIDSAGNISGNNLSGTNTGDITLGTANGLSLSGQALSLGTSSSSTTGALSSTDWSTFNGKQAAGSYITALTGDGAASGPGSAALTLATVNSNVGSFTNAAITVNAKGLVTAASSGTTGNLTDAGTDGITVTSGTGAVLGSGTSLSQHVADTTHNGYLSSTDWNTFNGKQSALTLGNFTDVGTDGITVTGGTGAVIGSGTSLSQHVADTTHSGYLNSTDWNTFNGKGAGTVTSVSASVAAGGMTVSVSNPTTTPAVTITPKAPTTQTFSATGTQTGWVFPLVTANATAAATYTNNGHTFTVVNTITNGGSADLFVTGTGSLSGTTLTKATGTGDAAITFSVSAATASYTVPAGYLYLDVLVTGGGGGGGGGTSSGGTPGGVGTATLFGCAGVDMNGGRGAGGSAGAGNATVSDSNIANGVQLVFSTLGGSGEGGHDSRSTLFTNGGYGGASYFGGGGGGSTNVTGSTGQAWGSGGAGGGAAPTAGANSGGGGSAGSSVEGLITVAGLTTCYYATGNGGSAGTAGSNGTNGAGGQGGYVSAKEYYQ